MKKLDLGSVPHQSASDNADESMIITSNFSSIHNIKNNEIKEYNIKNYAQER